MPKNLMSLAISAMDEFDRIANLQDLLQICLDQGEEPLEKRACRTELLIVSYLNQVEQHMEGLQNTLEAIRQQIGTNR